MNNQTPKTLIIVLIIVSIFAAINFATSQSGTGKKTVSFVPPTSEEKKLHALINQYRREKGLPAIKLSKSLTHVAKTHAKDLNSYPPKGNCNAHGWSSNGPWTSCCYTSDHAQAKCMWNKPGELTNFRGNGFECAYWTSAVANASEALGTWKTSSGHNAVIINGSIWKRMSWKSIGVGVYGHYGVIWFAVENDPDGYWE